ncbi:MAG: SulP family inorganic anion transporter [bacterium]|nr:SulP family inorganic anion transporter [bacterium]
MFKSYTMKYLGSDLFAGIIVALMSIPISIGYTQVAGLPAVYGLYGSVFPILIFALVSTSPQMVFGVDAAPAALVGGLLANLGYEAYSNEALAIVPVITFYTACWLLLFYVLKAGKFVDFISTPVMGGFISGIACTIILMQIPKLMGSPSGEGELFELIEEIAHASNKINGVSLGLGLATLVIILISKKLVPKFPMAIVVMVLGAILTKSIHLERYGVVMLSKVEPGLPSLVIPDFSAMELKHGLTSSLTIAIVIMAETLLSSNNFALKNGYKLNDNREILAYSAGNFASAFTGCIPVNGSVSRTSIGEQFGSKTKVMSIVAGITMVLILLFGTGFIGYLPVPVLTAIIISALISVVELHLAIKLWKINRTEFMIFMAAFFGVLLLGTLYGVIIGGVLSFVDVIIRAVEPPRGFLGIIPGEEGFYDLDRNRKARPIKNTVIYRFGGNLFFANIKTFCEDIEKSIKGDTKNVIVDAGGISNIDVTAAERLEILCHNMQKQGVDMYLTGHVGAVNDQLRSLEMQHLIESGVVRRTITLALKDAGYHRPYPLEEVERPENNLESIDALQEIEWAFGKDAEDYMEHLTKEYLSRLQASDETTLSGLFEEDVTSTWGKLGLFDEDEFLKRLELHLIDIAKITGRDELTIEELIERRRQKNEEKLKRLNVNAMDILKSHRHYVAEQFKKKHPEEFMHLLEKRQEHIRQLQETDPEAAERWREWYDTDL